MPGLGHRAITAELPSGQTRAYGYVPPEYWWLYLLFNTGVHLHMLGLMTWAGHRSMPSPKPPTGKKRDPVMDGLVAAVSANELGYLTAASSGVLPTAKYCAASLDPAENDAALCARAASLRRALVHALLHSSGRGHAKLTRELAD